MPLLDQLANPGVVSAMLAPALLMAATGSLLISANARLSRVVDRLRQLVAQWDEAAPDHASRDRQVRQHRLRAGLVLRACWMLYAAMGCFVGTGLGLAIDALADIDLGAVPTVLAMLGMGALLLASLLMGREVGLAVRSFGAELDEAMRPR